MVAVTLKAVELLMKTPPIILETHELDITVSDRTLIKNLNWTVKQGERWCLIGRNGSGKSTLLRIIAGVQKNLSAGKIEYLGQSLTNYAPEDLARIRAYAEQSIVAGIGLRAIDAVLAAQWPWQNQKQGSFDHELAMLALQSCDVAHLAYSEWHNLSGGERQRVALGACFAQNTPTLILDEPTAHLDVGHQVALLKMLVEKSEEKQLTIISSLHEISLIGRGFTHALLLLEKGQYLSGLAEEIINADNLESALGHPIIEARTSGGQVIFVPA